MSVRSALVALLPLCLPIHAAASVLVVGPAGAPYATIADAVAASADGDTILVRSGSYAGFSLIGRGVDVVAEAGAVVQVTGTVTVSNLASGDRVVLSNLISTRGLVVMQNAGEVRVQECTFRGTPATGLGCSWSPNAGPGVLVQSNLGGVALVRCLVTGGQGGGNPCCTCQDNPGSDGGAGLRIAGGEVALFECVVEGGRGGEAGGPAGDGGTAVDVQGTSGDGVLLAGCTVRGGRGGDSWGDFVACAGSGGTGLVVGGGPVRLQQTVPVGGAAGQLTGAPTGCFGQPGLAVSGGSTVAIPQPALHVDVTSPIRELVPGSIVARAAPGDVVALYLSSQPAFSAPAGTIGLLLVQPAGTPRARVLGVVPPSGTLTVTIAWPELGPGVESGTRFLQVLRRGGSGGPGSVTLGGTVAVTVLDAAF